MKRIEDYEYLEGHRIQNDPDELKKKEDIKDDILYKLKEKFNIDFYSLNLEQYSSGKKL